MNGAVRIAALTTVPASSRTITHHRSKGAPTSAHESVPDAISRAVREVTLAITLPRTGSAASRSPAMSRNGCGVVEELELHGGTLVRDAVVVHRLIVLVAAAALLSACEEDMGQDDWVLVVNNTDERVYVEDPDRPAQGYRVAVEPGEMDRAPTVDRCDLVELVARSGSEDGPVVGTRSLEEARDCTETWVVGPDPPPTDYSFSQAGGPSIDSAHD